MNKNVNDYLTEVIQHLMAVDGADVELTLEVSVNAPGGIPSMTVRTVSENCRTLKIQNLDLRIIDTVMGSQYLVWLPITQNLLSGGKEWPNVLVHHS